MINLLQPFESEDSFSGQINVDGFKLREVQQTIVSSRIAFETIMRIYYMRHSFESCDPALTYFLPFMFNMALKYLSNELDTPLTVLDTEKVRCSTLVLSAKGLQSHGRMHVLTRLV
jgi:hypothetical protein